MSFSEKLRLKRLDEDNQAFFYVELLVGAVVIAAMAYSAGVQAAV